MGTLLAEDLQKAYIKTVIDFPTWTGIGHRDSQLTIKMATGIYPMKNMKGNTLIRARSMLAVANAATVGLDPDLQTAGTHPVKVFTTSSQQRDSGRY